MRKRDATVAPVLQSFGGANGHDPVAFAAPYALNATNHGRPAGRDGMQRIAELLLAAFPDVRFEVDATVVEGDAVMCEVTMTGTHLGQPKAGTGRRLADLPPTGRSVRQRQMHWFRVVDGEIAEHRAVRDDLELLTQLGLEEVAPAAGP